MIRAKFIENKELTPNISLELPLLYNIRNQFNLHKKFDLKLNCVRNE